VSEVLRAPFPWFGGKSDVASLVWDRFGNVGNYVEPFFGSGAVLLQRPHDPGVETINDADGFVSNFWRAVQHDSDSVAEWSDWPINENDMHARHAWLVEQRADFTRKLEGDPDYFDAKIAGYWVWGICLWIGSGWCSGNGPWSVVDRKLVHLGDKGRGINRQRVHLGDKGMGINRKRVHLGNKGMGINRKLVHLGDKGRGDELREVFGALRDRLRHVRVCCGDWTRVCGPTPTTKFGVTAVMLDPPYDDTRQPDLYRVDSTTVAADVARWCAANGDNPDMRIALCGYDGSFDPPKGWDTVEWKARGGYGSQGDDTGRANAARERIWFSPHCLTAKQLSLFGGAA